jgi:hypothetical protein
MFGTPTIHDIPIRSSVMLKRQPPLIEDGNPRDSFWVKLKGKDSPLPWNNQFFHHKMMVSKSYTGLIPPKKHPSFVVVKSSHVLKKSFFQPCHQWLSPILNHGIPGVALSPLTRSSGFPLSHPTRWRWREHSKASDTSSSPGHTWKRFRDPDFFCPG